MERLCMGTSVVRKRNQRGEKKKTGGGEIFYLYRLVLAKIYDLLQNPQRRGKRERTAILFNVP
jgi:hypothetical protein